MNALHALLAAATLASTSGGPIAVTTSPDRPPPGAKEDQALWTAGYETQTGALLEQERARRAVVQLAAGRYYDRLAAAGRASSSAREATLAASRELAGAADGVGRTAQPPFDLRTGCRYQLVGLGNAMVAAQSPKGAPALDEARRELAACRDTVERWRAPLAHADDALERALARADALLAGPGGAAAAPTATTPASAPGTSPAAGER